MVRKGFSQFYSTQRGNLWSVHGQRRKNALLLILVSLLVFIFNTAQIVSAAEHDRNSDLVQVNQVVFIDDFETGDFSKWSIVKNGADLLVTAPATSEGNFGLQVLVNDTSTHHLKDLTPNQESHYRARFYLDLNSLAMANNNQFVLFRGRDSGNAFQLNLRYKNAPTRFARGPGRIITAERMAPGSPWSMTGRRLKLSGSRRVLIQATMASLIYGSTVPWSTLLLALIIM